MKYILPSLMKTFFSFVACATLTIAVTGYRPVSAQPVEPGIFYVRIFDGFMPVPSRYGVDATAVESRQAVRLISPVLLSGETTDPQPAIGYIETGRRPRNSAEPFSQDEDVEITRRLAENGLDIILFDYKNVVGLSGVYLYTDKEFMLIVDEDPRLWRQMLDAFVDDPVE